MFTGEPRGNMAIHDAQGYVSVVAHRDFAMLNGGGWDSSDLGLHGDINFAPHETKTIRWLSIAPDFALDDPTLFFLVQEEGTLEGFELNL
jgi:hypothetical protein